MPDQSFFDETFWITVRTSGRSVYESITLLELFDKVQRCPRDKFLLVLDAHREEEMRGLFLVCGTQIDLHLIQDARLIMIIGSDEYDRIVYQYNPMEYAGQVEYTRLG